MPHLRNNTHALKLSLLKQLGLGPGQPAQVRSGDAELPRRGGDVAIMLRQHTLDQAKIEIGADGRRSRERHRQSSPGNHAATPYTRTAATPL